MCIVVRGSSFCENLMYLFGYETLCYTLFEDRQLVDTVAKKLLECEESACKVVLQSKRVKMYWGDDDMGFTTGTMLSPKDNKDLVLDNHKRIAELVHEAGHPYILHSCGNRKDIINDIIDFAKIDGVHSWEDNAESITDAKKNYGNRISVLGGLDVDFLCRATESEIRKRVRETIEICQPGGGFCLGTGSSVANYIPFENYLIMLDEGRNY